MSARLKPPGAQWSVLAQGAKPGRFEASGDSTGIEFDEFFLQHPFIHLERMNDREWWIDMGGYHFWLRAMGRGKTKVWHNGKELRQIGLHCEDDE